MLNRFHWLPLLLLALGAASALFSLFHRFQVERESRAVALALDYSQLRVLTSATGVPTAEAYRDFRQRGITSVAVTEDTLGDLMDHGELAVRVARVGNARQYRLQFGDP